MAIKCYGSLEAYQKSQEPVAPAILDPGPPSATANSNPNNVHYISTTAPANGAKSPNSSNGNGPDFWERRRNFRQSIFEKLSLRRWLPSPAVTNGSSNSVAAAAGGGAAKPATRRASTTYGAGGSASSTNANTGANASALQKNRKASATTATAAAKK